MKELNQLTSLITNETTLFSKENVEKALFLESLKKSTKTPILYFLEKDLNHIKKGFSKGTLSDLKVNPLFEKRSLLEYLPMQRHPIPYCVVRCKKEDKYFLIFREGGSGETRLIGMKGLLGGHIDEADKALDSNHSLNLVKTIENGMYRELEEEANLTKDLIKEISLFGFIKIDEAKCVENDHLAIVYIIDVDNTKLNAVEEGVLSGDWFTKEEIIENKSSLERWSEIVFDELFK